MNRGSGLVRLGRGITRRLFIILIFCRPVFLVFLGRFLDDLGIQADVNPPRSAAIAIALEMLGVEVIAELFAADVVLRVLDLGGAGQHHDACTHPVLDPLGPGFDQALFLDFLLQ